VATKKGQPSFFDYIEDKYADYFRTIEKENAPELIKSISTGATSLDVSIGIGGVPMRKFTEIYGAEASGKSTICTSIAKNALAMGYNVLYIDPEQSFDLHRAEQIGGPEFLNSRKFTLVQPEYMEDALELCEMGIRDTSANFGVIFLDSIASMTPKKVKDDELMDNNPFILARRWTQFLQRNIYDIRIRDVAFIGVNQVRDDTKNTYVPTLSTPGGHYWKHVCSLRIQLRKSADIEQDGEKIGILSNFVIKKSKVGRPFRSFNIPIIFDSGIDSYRDIIEFAKSLGIVTTAGPYFKFEGVTLGKGMEDVMGKLSEDKETLDKIKNVCYNLFNSQEVVTTDEEDEL
jgi:recombination protein RecA